MHYLPHWCKCTVFDGKQQCESHVDTSPLLLLFSSLLDPLVLVISFPPEVFSWPLFFPCVCHQLTSSAFHFPQVRVGGICCRTTTCSILSRLFTLIKENSLVPSNWCAGRLFKCLFLLSMLGVSSPTCCAFKNRYWRQSSTLQLEAIRVTLN
jgi:hypothetical protein